MSERKTREMRQDRRLSEALTANLERDSEGGRVFLLWRLKGGMIYSIWVKRMCLERKHSEDGPGVHARHGSED